MERPSGPRWARLNLVLGFPPRGHSPPGVAAFAMRQTGRRFAVEGEQVKDQIGDGNTGGAVQQAVADQREVRLAIVERGELAVEDAPGGDVSQLEDFASCPIRGVRRVGRRSRGTRRTSARRPSRRRRKLPGAGEHRLGQRHRHCFGHYSVCGSAFGAERAAALLDRRDVLSGEASGC